MYQTIKAISAATQQLALYDANPEINELISLFEIVEQLNIEDIEKLRKKLQDLLLDPENYSLTEDIPLSLADVTWHGLIVLSELLPLNAHENGLYCCPITLNPISNTNVILLASGNRYDINALTHFLSTSSRWFEPMTNVDLVYHDCIHIFEKILEKGLRLSLDRNLHDNITIFLQQYQERLARYHRLLCEAKLPSVSTQIIDAWSEEKKAIVPQLSKPQQFIWMNSEDLNPVHSYTNERIIQEFQLERKSEHLLLQARASQIMGINEPHALITRWQMANEAANAADQEMLKIFMITFFYLAFGIFSCTTFTVCIFMIKLCHYDKEDQCIPDRGTGDMAFRVILSIPIATIGLTLLAGNIHLLYVLCYQFQSQQTLLDNALQTQPDALYKINRSRPLGFFSNYVYTADVDENQQTYSPIK